MTSGTLAKFRNPLLIAFILLNAFISLGQYDTVHYFPPFYSRASDANNLGRNFLFLSTNSTTPFDVTVTESNGTPIMIATISVTNSAQIFLGYQYDVKGIVDQSGLNVVLSNEGILATASSPFFANLRHTSGTQGMSLTSKGTWGMGTRFRSGHLYTVKSSAVGGPWKSHMISVMATEDNTTVKFSDFKEGVIFYGTATDGNKSEDITVTLNKHESYVIAAHVDEPLATGNDTLLNGVLITSDLPIVVNSGSWCGGSNVTDSSASRDIGMDQILPTNQLGQKYIVVKRFSFLEEECERVIVVADSDNTKIYLNGLSSIAATIDAGEFYIVPAAKYNANDILHIESSFPVYVYQSTNASGTFSHAQGLNFIPPLACSGMHEITVPKIDSFDETPAAIDVIARTGSVVLVDGVPIGVSPLPVPGNDEWEVYKLSNVVGTVNFWSDDNINIAMLANTGARGAAGYYSGLAYQFKAEVEAIAPLENNQILEGCVNGKFVLTKDGMMLNEDVTFFLKTSGEAKNGVDYNWLPESIVIPAGEISATLIVEPIFDQASEGNERIILTVINDKCGNVAISDTLYIQNYDALSIAEISENQLICPENGEAVTLSLTVEGGIQPYTYEWISDLSSAASIQVAPEIQTSYSVAISDGCTVLQSEPIIVYTICIPEVPNIITANGDGVNDQFLIENIEDFSGSRLMVQNRWGNVVYQSDDYDNSWTGTNLVDGSYFYCLDLNLGEDIDLVDFNAVRRLTGYVQIAR